MIEDLHKVLVVNKHTRKLFRDAFNTLSLTPVTHYVPERLQRKYVTFRVHKERLIALKTLGLSLYGSSGYPSGLNEIAQVHLEDGIDLTPRENPF